MTEADPDQMILDRLRTALADDPNIVEKRMFGGHAFMLNGNMLCGISSKGQFMARVGKDLEAEALTLPGANRIESNGKKIAGMLLVDDTAIDDDALNQWIALCTRFVGPMPPK